MKYIQNEDLDDAPAMGVEMMEKKVSMKHIAVDVSINIWSLSGDRQFMPLMSIVCADAKAIIFVFDLTDQKSLDAIRKWWKEARKKKKV